MSLYGPKRNDPITMSIERMEHNLHKLKQLGPHGNPNLLWETAGHIWGAVYWICELTKNPKIMQDAWDIRLALGHVVSKQHRIDSDLTPFDLAIQKITSASKNIQQKV